MSEIDKIVAGALEATREKLFEEMASQILTTVRKEFTVLPRFAFHQPLDYLLNTFPATFDTPEMREGLLPIPGSSDRMGYSPNNTEEYLESGKFDHDEIMNIVDSHFGADRTRGFRLLDFIMNIVDSHFGADRTRGFRLLDFGCSTGRVLRHFDAEQSQRDWKLSGVDVQARPIQWLRQHFPKYFEVFTGSLLPHLPFEDNHFDVVYGISVFTHIKFLWDLWILELRRITKPGGLIIQTFHGEEAWRFYHKNRNLDWVKQNHSQEMLQIEDMNVPYFFYGDISVSQVFWKEDTAREYWSRYLTVIDIRKPPPKFSFQNWIICKK